MCIRDRLYSDEDKNLFVPVRWIGDWYNDALAALGVSSVIYIQTRGTGKVKILILWLVITIGFPKLPESVEKPALQKAEIEWKAAKPVSYTHLTSIFVTYLLMAIMIISGIWYPAHLAMRLKLVEALSYE